MHRVILAMLRFILKRQSGGLSTPRRVAELHSSPMPRRTAWQNEYRSVREGIVLVGR
jgi:hypothetical protein